MFPISHAYYIETTLHYYELFAPFLWQNHSRNLLIDVSITISLCTQRVSRSSPMSRDKSYKQRFRAATLDGFAKQNSL